MLEVALNSQVGAFELDVNFTSNSGVTALFGQSGAGKTTIINMLGGLRRPQSGRIVLGGRVLFDSASGLNLPPQQRQLGYVFQEACLFPHLSVRSNLAYGRWFAKNKASPQIFNEIVELLGIGDLLKRRPRHLSGGEKQRVAIGRALLSSPAALLLDEPMASLDGARKNEILPYLDRLCSETRIPIIYVSHSIDEVTQLAQTLVVLSKGKVQAVGAVGELMSRLDLRPLTGRFEAGTILKARVIQQDPDYALTTVRLNEQTLRVPYIEAAKDAIVRVRVRARDVSISRQPLLESSIINSLAGVIREVVPESGPYAEINIEVDGQLINARLTRWSVDRLQLRPGDRVYAQIKSIALDRVS